MIYTKEIPELLSVSLGAAETTLMNLTSAYAPFVNGGKKIEPNLISEFKIEEAKLSLKQNLENVWDVINSLIKKPSTRNRKHS